MSSRQFVVACDESGFSGTNLLDPTSEVITHASVHLDTRTAAEYVALIRSRFRYSATEYKSTQLLRQRPALEWLLRTLPGRAHVHLTDKSFFVVTRLVDYLIGDPSYAAGDEPGDGAPPDGAGTPSPRAGRLRQREVERVPEDVRGDDAEAQSGGVRACCGAVLQ